MSTRTAIIILVAALILAGGYIFLFGVPEGGELQTDDVPETSDLLAEENAVVAQDQQPGNEVAVAQVYLAEPGYVVIHEDNDGTPGAILGTSSLLEAGQTDDVAVALSRQSQDGERLWAMLHTEADGNATFDAATDTPVASILGGVVMGSFTISADAEAGGEISL